MPGDGAPSGRALPRDEQLYPYPTLHPVDSNDDRNHSVGVSKKPPKIEETAAPYAAKKPVKPVAPASPADQPPQIRYATPEQVRKAAEEVFKVHEELFRKLAQ